jgi:hypothetical protein
MEGPKNGSGNINHLPWAASRYIADLKSAARNHLNWSRHQHIKCAKEKKKKKKKNIASDLHFKTRSVKKLIRDARSVDVIRSDNGSPLADAEQFRTPSYYAMARIGTTRSPVLPRGSALTIGGIHLNITCSTVSDVTLSPVQRIS